MRGSAVAVAIEPYHWHAHNADSQPSKVTWETSKERVREESQLQAKWYGSLAGLQQKLPLGWIVALFFWRGGGELV